MSAEVKLVELFSNPDLDPIPNGIRIGNLVHCARVNGIDPQTGVLAPVLDQQLEFGFRNMRSLVEQAGGSPENIAQVKFFFKDFSGARAVNKPWMEMFPDETDRPTYICMPANLEEGQLVNLKAFAVLGARRKPLNIFPVAHKNPIPMGVRIGNMIFSSRILPHDPTSGKPVESAEQQAECLFQNLRRLLSVAEAEPADITQARAFIGDRAYLAFVEKQWNRLLPDASRRPLLQSVLYTSVPHLRVMMEIIAVDSTP